jgi:V8-like Glu-specific endopeptidase
MKFILLSLIALNSFAFTIYGKDDRQDWFEVSDTRLKDIALSTAVQLDKKSLYYSEETKSYKVPSVTYKDKFKVCRSQKYAEQISAGHCTAFLVNEDTIVTAGHCVQNLAQCKSSAWVFDYKLTSLDADPTSVDRKNIYECKSLVKSKQSTSISGKKNYKADFAIIKLDRKTSRTPFQLSTRRVRSNTPLAVIGYPRGLPLKIAGNGKVLNMAKRNFRAELDAFGGNSGSPVINLNTFEVVGLLTSGGSDFFNSSEKRDGVVITEGPYLSYSDLMERNARENQFCRKEAVHKSSVGKGEDVSKISNVMKYL